MNVTQPKDQVAIGFVNVNGERLDVDVSQEYMRFFFSLVQRVGGVSSLTNAEIADLVAQIEEASLVSPQTDLTAQEAARGVDELRNELASLRSDAEMLRGQIEEQRAELQALRAVADLRQRVEQLEDRLT